MARHPWADQRLYRKTLLTALRGFFEQVLSMTVIIGIKCRLSFVSGVTAWPTISCDVSASGSRCFAPGRIPATRIAEATGRQHLVHHDLYVVGERPGPCPRGPLPKTATITDRMSRKLHAQAGAAV